LSTKRRNLSIDRLRSCSILVIDVPFTLNILPKMTA